MGRTAKDKSGASDKPLPTNIKALLKSRNETQDDLGRVINKSRPVVGQYCRGESEPDLDTLVRIADHFGVSIDFLLGMPNAPEKTDADKGNAMRYMGINESSIDSIRSIAASHKEVFELLLCSPNLMECMERVEWVQSQMLDPHGYRYSLTPQYGDYETNHPIDDKDGNRFFLYKMDLFDLIVGQAFEYLKKEYKESVLDAIRQYFE